ncbi:hypothetical protein BCR33DRAFT_94316 [Rhizoclosmatium globosum]|uniref:Uncharacterized protein n=1 Tax=Rhizoclosmatium globosum TaxID=329046 RepID=A0A1Y2CK24_9FUNG|nr:hypothetical protein BCR33DRAFT_94316 [Rhizoclosmatium globosum]|eukprot:ORY47336.1 hypothetical protein BCR33DRAFT_94316 [Rhizoclosmatium globosum]
MMKSTTPVPTPPLRTLDSLGLGYKEPQLDNDCSVICNSCKWKRQSRFRVWIKLKVWRSVSFPALESPIPPTSAPIESSKKDALRKQKKSISFSDKVMYRSLSSIDMEDQQLASYELQQQQALMAISDLWSDEEEEFGACVGGYEDETLYSEDGAGGDWPRNDEFEDMVDGTNIMSLPWTTMMT